MISYPRENNSSAQQQTALESILKRSKWLAQQQERLYLISRDMGFAESICDEMSHPQAVTIQSILEAAQGLLIEMENLEKMREGNT